jgi:GntR family transcriptional regulator
MEKGHPLPLYYRIKRDLLAAIEEGTLKAGDRVPSERELTERYGVSRMTARHALGTLEQEGFLQRVQGKGTFVAPPKLEQPLVGLNSFTEDMRMRGLLPSTQVRSVTVEPAGERLGALLGLPAAEPAYRIERLRLANGEPMALETVYLSARLVPGLPDLDLTRSLYALLEERWGIRLAGAMQSLEAVLAGPEEAEVLHVLPGAPLLALTRISKNRAGDPIEYTRSLYRADRYRFTVSLTRKEDGSQ